ncbi:MAG: RNA polymerase sigma factor [Rubripirellula sp.]
MNIDQKTIGDAAKGDPQAFERIVHHYSLGIVRYVCNMIGDQHAAEDVAQRVFVNLYRSIKKFDVSRGSFNTWLYRIARNAALNHLRDNRPHQTLLLTTQDELVSEESPSSNAELREQFAQLDAAVAALPDAQRSAWVLTEIEGLTQAQISAIEGVPEGTIKSRVSRARETLLKSLQNEIGMER